MAHVGTCLQTHPLTSVTFSHSLLSLSLQLPPPQWAPALFLMPTPQLCNTEMHPQDDISALGPLGLPLRGSCVRELEAGCSVCQPHLSVSKSGHAHQHTHFKPRGVFVPAGSPTANNVPYCADRCQICTPLFHPPSTHVTIHTSGVSQRFKATRWIT